MSTVDAEANFSKWHGLGNDYIIVAARDLPFKLTPERTIVICDRHFGIGSDGVLLWSGDEASGFSLEIHNPDGSMAALSGNGMRMLAKYLYQNGFAKDASLTVSTSAGVIKPTVQPDGQVRVFMGNARLGGRGIAGYEGAADQSEAVGVRLEAAGEEFSFTFVDMGNPHCVIETADLAAVEMERLGPALENHHLFTNRANVEFVKVTGPAEVSMRVWERGVGETSACGTGACAVAVAACRAGSVKTPVTVHLPGGDLLIEVHPDLGVHMTGPAEETYNGVMSKEFVNRIMELQE